MGKRRGRGEERRARGKQVRHGAGLKASGIIKALNVGQAGRNTPSTQRQTEGEGEREACCGRKSEGQGGREAPDL